MSNYGWEAGTIRLPSAEFSRVRKAVEAADRTRKEKVFARTQEFWKGLTRKQQTDPQAYRDALRDFHRETDAEIDRLRRTHSTGFFATPPRQWQQADEMESLSDAVYDRLSAVTLDRYEVNPETGRHELRPGKPRRVLVSDMEYPTNRTSTFHLSSGGSIGFDRDASAVHWSTSDNNHQVEHAHADPLAQVLFAELGKVRWTRGTGGVLTGNDEYNQDSREPGGGANYVTAGYGPLGAADPEAWSRTQEYTDSTGKRVRRDQFPGKKAAEKAWRTAARSSGGGPGRVSAGRPDGGQFTSRGYTEAAGGYDALRW